MSANVSFLVVLATKSGTHKICMNGEETETLEDLRIHAWLAQFFGPGPGGFQLPEGQSTAPEASFCVDYFTFEWCHPPNLDSVRSLPGSTKLASLKHKGVLLGVCSNTDNDLPSIVAARALSLLASNDPEVKREFGNDVHDGRQGLDVFISYSTQDGSVAEEIASEMRRRGYEVFLAHQNISVGPRWEDQVFNAARSCRVGVLVLSENSRNREWVQYEIGALVALGKQVAPALIGLQPSDLPELVRKYQARAASSPNERKTFCDELVRLLNKC